MDLLLDFISDEKNVEKDENITVLLLILRLVKRSS